MKFLIFATCLLFSVARAGDPTLADLSPTVDHMVEAVLSSDPAGYLSYVAPDDPMFFQEQKNWARDLEIHCPISFRIDLDGGGFAVQRDGSITVPMTMTWKMAENARSRRVSYPARFVERDGRWLYAGEQWVRVKAPGVEVLVEPEDKSVGIQIASVLPGVRERLDELSGITTERVQQVKVYGSMKHLQQSIYLSYTDPLGGWNEPGESIKLVRQGIRSGQQMRSLLAHEYGHVITFALGSDATHMPWWVLEGFAEYCSAVLAGSPHRFPPIVSRWAERGNLRTWDQLSDFRGEAMNHQGHVYAQGHHMIVFLVEQFGLEKLIEWLRAQAQGDALDDASRAVFGMSWADIDQAWQKSLGVSKAP
ncbi:MAG: hypothetical protein D6695_04950 [Planctomycetota bacterium]|nr:MAG: hypothetical protein D6695_04950 [Planctomycetota bacterium]